MGPGAGKRYKGRTTPYVVMTCIVAASGGALFGYDNGVSPVLGIARLQERDKC